MKKTELLKLIENMQDEDSVDSLFSFDKVKDNLLNDNTFKSFLDSEKDKHHSKALETWKSNNLNKLIDDEITKRFPQADPKDLKLQELQKQIEQMQKDTVRKDLTNKAIKIANEKKLPLDMIDFLIGQDEESTTKNLEKFESVFNTSLEQQVQTKLSGGYTPPSDKQTGLTEEQQLQAQINEIMGIK
ncbi:DUF4355 domain-containing protein [Clostridium sp. C8-1-8]|uniref:DUF4355 domain-containing protein n=1 Tax=Clostridium sp. C8-1-8 TaxID=2698831 RepID=UPI00136B8153|nr:DUF4355 domain-containing protein [Clostridium sp. C8-1-8]